MVIISVSKTVRYGFKSYVPCQKEQSLLKAESQKSAKVGQRNQAELGKSGAGWGFDCCPA